MLTYTVQAYKKVRMWDTWTWDTKDKPAASTVKSSPCKDQICNPATELFARAEIELTVAGTRLDNAIPPALQKIKYWNSLHIDAKETEIYAIDIIHNT